MKKSFTFTLAILALLVSVSSTAQAQEEKHFFLVQTYKSVMPDGGSIAERDSLLTLYFEEVTMKNEYIISERHLRHYSGSNGSDWVRVREFKNWSDIETGLLRNTELYRQKWDTREKRLEFSALNGKYWGEGHSDEIYTDFPQFKK